MRAGIILLLLILWILSGDDAPQTAYLQKALSDLQEEASFCANRTFGTNLTYVRLSSTANGLKCHQEANSNMS